MPVSAWAITLALAVPALVLPGAARAWGDLGHQVIGNLAYPRLTPAARQAVDALLAQDTDSLSAPDFASRTTWADKYRDSLPSAPKQRYLATREWHYVDIQIEGGSLDAACHGRIALAPGTLASAGPARSCVVDKLLQFSQELADPATPTAERILALKFVMHFVGDLHQPLHAADHHDHGGNAITVRPAAAQTRIDLHRYWDSYLVRRVGTTLAKASAQVDKHITPARAAAWAQGTVDDWALETHGQARAAAYDLADQQPLDEPAEGLGKMLDEAYEARGRAVVRESLAKAAVRLAHLLNGLFR
jgi:hypothetical protein